MRVLLLHPSTVMLGKSLKLVLSYVICTTEAGLSE